MSACFDQAAAEQQEHLAPAILEQVRLDALPAVVSLGELGRGQVLLEHEVPELDLALGA